MNSASTGDKLSLRTKLGTRALGQGISSTAAHFRGFIPERTLLRDFDPDGRLTTFLAHPDVEDRPMPAIFVDPSQEVARDIALNVPLVALDVGKHITAIVCTLYYEKPNKDLGAIVIRRHVRNSVSSGTRQDAAQRANAAMNLEDLEQHAQQYAKYTATTGKTVDPAKLERHMNNISSPNTKNLFDDFNSQRRLMSREQLFRDNQTHKSYIVNLILEMCDAAIMCKERIEAADSAISELPATASVDQRNRAAKLAISKKQQEQEVQREKNGKNHLEAVRQYSNPILIIGDGGRHGGRLPDTRSLAGYLGRFFAVVLLDEYKTSQVGS